MWEKIAPAILVLEIALDAARTDSQRSIRPIISMEHLVVDPNSLAVSRDAKGSFVEFRELRSCKDGYFGVSVSMKEFPERDSVIALERLKRIHTIASR
ncbi:hypothetical protein AOQ71_29180 [Bradyrhizobium manausense]|uniref:Uncharacterized protein n=1 Tax=Bradyrhizobium manausense TaxID=989370 RepID=A0A0R3DF38_9BRAD|nr:hypothetical protein [Bradyrhizobium manausense]KRQ04927.1 hypothetical protein AOQ71_29180 [Bradyrhizobium manausense]